MLKSNKAEPKNESLENNERLQSKSKIVTKKIQCEICNIRISNEFNYSRHVKACSKKLLIKTEVESTVNDQNSDSLKSSEAVPKNETLDNNDILHPVKVEPNIEDKHKCKICNTKINNEFNYTKHVSACKKYSKFFEKSSSGFSCLLCPFQSKKAGDLGMFKHLRLYHSICKKVKEKNKIFEEKLDSQIIYNERKDEVAKNEIHKDQDFKNQKIETDKFQCKICQTNVSQSNFLKQLSQSTS